VRQIGTLTTEDQARTLADHLKSLGMTTRVDPEAEGWAIWVYNEDHLPRARDELQAFSSNPDDPRYKDAKRSAEALDREERQRDQLYRKNVRNVSGRWDGASVSRNPLTILLIVISILVFFLERGGYSITSKLLFSSFELGNQGELRSHGLEDILHGEFWRLITPIFLHSNVLHILFNMWWLKSLGTVIEHRRGTLVLSSLVFLSAICSNMCEFAYEYLKSPTPGAFGGMSGVVYALFGYVWMKGRFEPEQGMILHPQSVRLMLLWLVVCMTGIVGPVANVAHVVGLIMGMLFSLARF
jgi:GlpG protein